jgi:hypothetical protein
MPRGSYSVDIDASCDAVFDIVHDYERRLAWDTMLREARLVGGAKAAGMGVRSLCVGTWRGAFQALETEYIRFERGRVAAVKLTNHPAFFRNFAATIQHEALGADRSRVTYIYSFQARPVFLAPILEPIMHARLKPEVRGRLHGLRDYVERARASAPSS